MRVTEAAMRPASDQRRCFYCHQPIGSDHGPDCVLVRKKVKVRMTVEYEIDVPANWDKGMVEFHRNEGTWCADNAVEELQAIIDKGEGCLCGCTEYEYIEDTSEPFLKKP